MVKFASTIGDKRTHFGKQRDRTTAYVKLKKYVFSSLDPPIHFKAILSLSINWKTQQKYTTDSMKQINLQARGVLDDLTCFRYTKSRMFFKPC